jgi:hypothetical protein
LAAAGDPGADAARARIATTLEAARRVELARLVVTPPGIDAEQARERASGAADGAGRSALVHEARDAAIAYVTRAYASQGFSGTWAMTEMALSVTRAADRVAIARALADAVTADAVEDLVDDETVDVLRHAWGSLGGSTALPDNGSIANLTSSLAGWAERRGGWQALVAAGLLSLLGLGQLAIGQPFGVAFLAVGAVVLRNALAPPIDLAGVGRRHRTGREHARVEQLT